MPADLSAMLACHPGSRSAAVREVHARARWLRGGALGLSYLAIGDIDRLRVPPPSPARNVEGLWRHTCFEAFVATKGKAAYREFNFAPSGEWAAYAFRRYRAGAKLASAPRPQIAVRRCADRLELDAVLHREALPADAPGRPLRLALSAVLEEDGGMLSYWALKHPPGRPDFHRRAAFALELPAHADAVEGGR